MQPYIYVCRTQFEMNKRFTSYYGQLRNLANTEIVPISITIKPPKWFTGPKYTALAPTNYVQSLIKFPDRFAEEFERYLWRLNSHEVLKELNVISGGKPWALLAYERPGEFSHRHLVAAWLAQNEKHISITEFVKGIYVLS